MEQEMKKRIVKALQRTWDQIKYDVMETSGSLSNDEVLETCADYLSMYGNDRVANDEFWKLSYEEQAGIGKIAFPIAVYCA